MTAVVQALAGFPSPSNLLTRCKSEPGALLPPQTAQEFDEGVECSPCKGVISTEWLAALVASSNVQEVTGLDSSALHARLSKKWTAESALKDCKFLKHCLAVFGADEYLE